MPDDPKPSQPAAIGGSVTAIGTAVFAVLVSRFHLDDDPAMLALIALVQGAVIAAVAKWIHDRVWTKESHAKEVAAALQAGAAAGPV